MPYEQFFFDWRGGDEVRRPAQPLCRALPAEPFGTLRTLIAAHPRAANANLDHPYFARQTPRTMLIDEMEALWSPIADHDDWAPLYAALGEIEQMRQAYAGE